MQKLEMLSLTENNMTNAANLCHLTALQSLNLSSNSINSTSDILPIVKNKSLIEINLCDNPIKKNRKFRQLLILSSPSLLSINGKDVTTFEREFTISLSIRKPKPVESNPVLPESVYFPVTAVPHLPPYASQYRDLLLHQMATSGTKQFVINPDPAIAEEEQQQ
jgi:hypothetical protein